MITDEADLLALLRAAPTSRIVAHPGNEGPGVYESDARLRPLRLVAPIGEEGSARALLQAAHQADVGCMIEEWLQLPLRYGPLVSTWVLRQHPQCPHVIGG